MKYFLATIGLFISLFAWGQTYVSDIKLKDVNTQKDVSLYDFKSKKAIVVIFTANFCPYSKLYHQRIKDLYKAYEGKDVQFLLINPSTQSGNPDETAEATDKKMKELGYTFPSLIDIDNKAINAFKASKTPECFVLVQFNNQLKVAYSGAIDDNPQVASDVSQQYLKDAIEASLNGRNPAIRNTRATGCMIKK